MVKPRRDKATKPDAFLGYTIARLAHALERRLEDALSSEGLTMRQFGVLAHLSRTPGLGSAEIARLVVVTPQSMGALIESLVNRKLVQREGNRALGLKVGLRLTAPGEARLRRSYSIVGSEQAMLAKILGRSEAIALNRQLFELLKQVSPMEKIRQESIL